MKSFNCYSLLHPDGYVMPAYTNISAQAVKLHVHDGLGEEWPYLQRTGYRVVKCVIKKVAKK